MMVKGRPCVPCVLMEMELSKRRDSPREDLGFIKPWIGDVFALGFDKPVELCQGLPRMNLGFNEPCICRALACM